MTGMGRVGGECVQERFLHGGGGVGGPRPDRGFILYFMAANPPPWDATSPGIPIGDKVISSNVLAPIKSCALLL